MPAWFIKPNGAAIYHAARPQLDFISQDADTVDFPRGPALEALRQGVTGWVFATGSDALNLRASLALHRAIMTRHVDPAPILVRIPTGHAQDAPEVIGRTLIMARTFGGIDDVIARSPVMQEDPDALPMALHRAYSVASVEMGLASGIEVWTSLPETKRNANRNLFRHSVMKIEDFGGEAQGALLGVPIIDPDLAAQFRRIESALDFARITRDNNPSNWIKDSEKLGSEDLAAAIRLRDAAVVEHNRWTMDRILQQFLPTSRPERALRDDVRRLHDNMHDWYDLSSDAIRRYDVVMLRALISGDGDTCARLTHRASVREVSLGDITPINGGTKITELRVRISPRSLDEVPLNDQIELVASQIGLQSRETQRCRIVLIFDVLPAADTFGRVTALAQGLRQQIGETVAIETVWQTSNRSRPARATK